MKKMKTPMLLLVTALLSACGDSGQTPVSTDMSTDRPTDMPEELKPDGDMDTPICQPQTQCAANTCGMVDDGCGGQLDCGGPRTCEDLGQVCGTQDDGCGAELDCGVCLCENGTPLEPTCGTCGLGRLSCEGNAGTCIGPDLEACTQVLYVQANHPNAGEGSLEAPLPSIQAALERAQELGQGTTIVVLGNARYEESVELIEGVHLLGGYDEQGLYAPELKPTITGRAKEEASVLAVSAKNIIKPTRLQGFKIQTVDSYPGGDNIGLWLSQTEGLELVDLEIITAQAGEGASGADGQPGANADSQGLKGIGGESGGRLNNDGSNARLFGAPSVIVDNGMSNRFCPGRTKGGRGGEGAQVEQAGTIFNVQGAQPGQRAVADLGQPIEGQPGDRLANAKGKQGSHGVPPDDALAPQPPRLEQIQPQLEADRFELIGGHGQDGLAGEDGMGGQGGGGAFIWQQYLETRRYWLEGPQGGGGGAGGCGGQGGQGGRAGHSSIGIILDQSKLSTLERVTITVGQGGAGGAGGRRGLGGSGSVGGLGTRMVCGDSILGCFEAGTPSTYGSGSGGTGSAGARGADGGRGVGGWSLGVACFESSVERLPSVILTSPPAEGSIKGVSLEAWRCQ